MDSLSQFVLGAAVGEVTLGKKLGNKAVLLGGIAGTIPDLDVFVTRFFKDDLMFLTIHRGYSHALFVHVFLAIPLAYLCMRIFKEKIPFGKWHLLWWLGLSTHAILDSFTTYGTQLLLPFSNYQVAFNNISVVDPLYTIPFLLFTVACMFVRRDKPLRRKIALSGWIISCTYILLTFGLKWKAHQAFETALEQQQIKVKQLSTSPTLLNAIFWSSIAVNDSMIYVGEYSITHPEKPIVFHGYPLQRDAEQKYASQSLERLNWFSNGFHFMVPETDSSAYYYNIKWGRTNFDETDPPLAFRFYYQLKIENGKVVAAPIENKRDKEFIRRYWNTLMQNIF